MKTIRCVIDKTTGRITIAAEGFSGAECLEATKRLEQGLGLRDPEREMTAEFYNTTATEQTQELGGA